jgi:hypothetical protein
MGGLSSYGELLDTEALLPRAVEYYEQRAAVAQAFQKLKEVKKGKWNPGAGSSMLGASKSLSASPSKHRSTFW